MLETSTHILIVDDRPLVRSGLRSLLERSGEFKVVGEGSDAAQYIRDKSIRQRYHDRHACRRKLSPSRAGLRQKEILQLLVSGKTNREVSTLLDVSIPTIETHRINIFQKLHVLPEVN